MLAFPILNINNLNISLGSSNNSLTTSSFKLQPAIPRSKITSIKRRLNSSSSSNNNSNSSLVLLSILPWAWKSKEIQLRIKILNKITKWIWIISSLEKTNAALLWWGTFLTDTTNKNWSRSLISNSVVAMILCIFPWISR